MNEIQTDLHKFFKAKKNLRDHVSNKHKGNLKDGIDTYSVGLTKELCGNGETTLIVPTGTSSVTTLEVSTETPATTPKRKIDSEEILVFKRKKSQLESKDEESIPHTPDPEQKNDLSLEVRKIVSAKKRLKLENLAVQNKKKLDPEAVKKELGTCGRLDELRARLLRLNKCEEKIKLFKSHQWKAHEATSGSPSSPKKITQSPKKRLIDNKGTQSPFKSSIINSRASFGSPSSKIKFGAGLQLRHFDAIDIEVPISPSKSPCKGQTPTKSPRSFTTNSCHERFAHLIEPSSDHLTLSRRYQLIKEVFRAVDTVVSFLHNRQELITFSKLKPAVQEMLRKSFSENQLGQLKTVFPLAYFFKQEKARSNQTNLDSKRYQLTITPNMDYKQNSPVTVNLMDKFSAQASAVNSRQYRKMDSVVLVERRHIFHKALIDILKKHHNEFLQNLDPPIALDGTLRSWHKDFPIEDIPAPEVTPLPKPPSEEVHGTAQDVLEKARDMFGVNNRMKAALETAVLNSPTIKNDSTTAPCQKNTENSPIVAALKGVSFSLLEKIRAREAAKAAKEMTRPVAVTRELEMLSRLPEIARIIRNLFVSEKRAALAWDTVLAKVSCSYSNMISASEVDSHLHMLIKEAPDWCTIHKVQSGIFLKLDKQRPLSEIIDKLNKVIKEKS